MSDAKSPAWTRETFLQALGKVICEVTRAARLQSERGHMLSHFGIQAQDVTDPGQAPEITIPAEADDTYVGAGIHLRDLTPEARAKRDAENLAQTRRQAYQWMREQATYGYVPEDAIVRHLGTLGFPAPKTTTNVRVNFYDPDHQYHEARFTLPGEVTSDQVKAKLAGVIGAPKTVALIKGAFPDATGSHLDNGAAVRTSHERVWADSSEVK